MKLPYLCLEEDCKVGFFLRFIDTQGRNCTPDLGNLRRKWDPADGSGKDPERNHRGSYWTGSYVRTGSYWTG